MQNHSIAKDRRGSRVKFRKAHEALGTYRTRLLWELSELQEFKRWEIQKIWDVELSFYPPRNCPPPPPPPDNNSGLDDRAEDRTGNVRIGTPYVTTKKSKLRSNIQSTKTLVHHDGGNYGRTV